MMPLALTLALLSCLAGDADEAPAKNARAQQQVDLALARGFEYLERTQQRGGCWVGDVGHKQENDYLVLDEASRQRADGDGNVGVTALAGLAFLAGGHVPGRSTYGPVVERALHYLLRVQNDYGYITDSGTRMYDHAFATLFLSQVFGMEKQSDFRDQLDRATHLIVDCQNEQGGWRYNPFVVEADLSVTVCQLQALRAAHNAGISVPKSTIDRAVDYVRRSRIEGGRDDGCYYYKIEGRAARSKTSFAINAAAVTSLLSAGIYDQREFERAIRSIEKDYHEISDYFPDHFYFWYGNYYAAQVLFHVGGSRWDRYFENLRRDLVSRQREDGSWGNSVGPGPEFATAMACLLLQIPKQELPIFQR